MQNRIHMEESDMVEAVMPRVFVIYVLRRLALPLAAEVLVVAGLLVSVEAFVSVPNVWTNVRAVSSVSSWLQYILSALAHTEFVLQALLFLGVVSSIYFFRKLLRTTIAARRSVVRA